MTIPDLPCPKCGAMNEVLVQLADPTDLRCDQCGDGFTTDDVREMHSSWEKVPGLARPAPGER